MGPCIFPISSTSFKITSSDFHQPFVDKVSNSGILLKCLILKVNNGSCTETAVAAINISLNSIIRFCLFNEIRISEDFWAISELKSITSKCLRSFFMSDCLSSLIAPLCYKVQIR